MVTGLPSDWPTYTVFEKSIIAFTYVKAKMHSVFLYSDARMSVSHISIYRVAQIKIPHHTKCNFSTTGWDFYTVPKFLDLYGRDPATIVKFFKNISVFSKVMAI